MSFLKKIFCGILLITGLVGPSFAENAMDNLRVYIRAKAPYVSMPKLMNFFKEVFDDQYFDAEAAILASSFGHPNYEGLSSKENVALFSFCKIGEQPERIAVAKFKKNSALKSRFLSSGLFIKDVNDWSLISTQKDILDRLSDPETLINITEKNLKTDIEICPVIKRLSENLNIDTLNRIFEPKDKTTLDRMRFVLDTIRDELDCLRKIAIAVEFGETETRLGLLLYAKPNSDVGALFSADAGGVMDIPEFTFKSAPVVSTFSFIDVGACQTFLDKLWHKLLKNSDFVRTDIHIQRSVDIINELGKHFKGQSASYSFINKKLIDKSNCDNKHISPDEEGLLVLNGSFDNSHAEEVCSELFQNFSPSKRYVINDPIRYQKQKIYSLNLDDCTLYSCVCRNNLLIGSSLDIMKEAIDAIPANKSKISLKKSCVTLSNIDLKKFFEAHDPNVLPKDFSNFEIKPLKYRANLGKNKYISALTVDNESLKNIIKTLSYMDEFLHDDDEKGENSDQPSSEVDDTNLTKSNEVTEHENH